MKFLAVAGMVLMSISAAASPVDIGFSRKQLPERAARMALTSLGLTEVEAERISRRPLPG